MQNIITENYELYLQHLRSLLKFRSEFTNPAKVKVAIEHCREVFENNLAEHTIRFDAAHNLIAVPNKIDPASDIVYLSAHIDTVGANETDWDKPYHPWQTYEDEQEIVARGVNDCKAGVAYQLFLSELFRLEKINLANVVFTITFKEEGAGEKTSREIGKQIGAELPISQKNTYLIVLENNVRVGDPATLCIYTAERSNYVIKIEGSIPELQEQLKKLENWNPVNIKPLVEAEVDEWQIVEQAGGHVCSVPREENKLTEVILQAKPNTLITAGDTENFATIPTQIKSVDHEKPLRHHLVLSNRTFTPLSEIEQELANIEYQQLKDFAVSQGFDIREKFANSLIAKKLSDCEQDAEIKIEYTYNIGGSDGTIIYGAINYNLKENFYPIVMGPGCRSQRKVVPKRLTHGKNETFNKKCGADAVAFISEILHKLGIISI